MKWSSSKVLEKIWYEVRVKKTIWQRKAELQKMPQLWFLWMFTTIEQQKLCGINNSEWEKILVANVQINNDNNVYVDDI